MQICSPMVAVAHELVMLPGWERSEGKPGVLTHVSGLISRRALQYRRPSLRYTEEPDVTRINIVVSVESENSSRRS